MRGLIKSILSFSWATSLFSVRQLLGGGAVADFRASLERWPELAYRVGGDGLAILNY
jgi:hypothetical protein